VDQRRSLPAFRFTVRRVVVQVVIQVVFFSILAILLGDDASGAVPQSPAPPSSALLQLTLLVFLLLARILVQKEDGPILIASVRLIGQHQLSEHVLVAGDCHGILVLHDGTAVNVKGSDQDVFDVVVRGPPGVL